ncbi:MAG TPA: BrnT family toxin [Longimicrobium sp.]|nr:BrnT family toxin [Longimicrobium sp.]
MDIAHGIEELLFVWNDRKAWSNATKHGVTFEEAAEVFLDPFAQGGDASVYGEARGFFLGCSLDLRILFVVYTERGAVTRIISSRPATRAETKRYEER